MEFELVYVDYLGAEHRATVEAASEYLASRFFHVTYDLGNAVYYRISRPDGSVYEEMEC
jgi:hypothetical protein